MRAHHTYDVAIRYRRPRDGKLSWFMGQQLAPNKGVAEDSAREAFEQEFPRHAATIIAVFVERHQETADELLTVLAGTPRDSRPALLSTRPVGILRAAADLCGQDSAEMTKRQAVRAIMENFG